MQKESRFTASGRPIFAVAKKGARVGWVLLAGLAALAMPQPLIADEAWTVSLQKQFPIEPKANAFHRVRVPETWQPAETAIIVCDMWDSHHAYRAVQRATEMAPRMDRVLRAARQAGATIIHAPSGCMDYYADHPSRKRALQVPMSEHLPPEIDSWCHQIPAEEEAVYPIDQSDGGEDDTPEEHAAWEQELRDRGLDPQVPWTHQMKSLSIDEKQDYITDRGSEVWSILEAEGIEQVILLGVHTNMCVLGRPFGLRRLAAAGQPVVLMRDLTDTMYNPASKPYVSHFTGTDLIIDHIERYVCPTITSDQLIGGASFRFSADQRPRLAMLIGESEYQTRTTLAPFAIEALGKDYRVDTIHAAVDQPNTFPGMERIGEADALLISVRRRTPPPQQLAVVRDFVRQGKPVIGLRTASHAFVLRNREPAAGQADWPEWDAEVFGGNYTNHYGNKLAVTVTPVPDALGHPIMMGMPKSSFPSGGSLYRVRPLREGTTPLLHGAVDGKPPEPVAWTFERADGGRSFYTSLGHVDDFQQPAFRRLLRQAIDWATQKEINPR